MTTKVLWFTTHAVTIEKDSEKDLNRNFGRGWVGALEYQLRSVNKLHLAIAFPDKSVREIEKVETRNRTIYKIPATKNKFGRWKRRLLNQLEGDEDKALYLNIINDFSPDIVQIYGTENNFASIIGTNVAVPIVIDLQGILTAIVDKWFSFISPLEAYWASSLKSKLKMNSHYQEYKIKVNRANRERKNLKDAKIIFGRTDWDCSVSRVLAPNSDYYHCDRVIKDEFWDTKWIGNTSDKKKFISVMNPDFYKGLEVVLCAAKILKELSVDFSWEVAGIQYSDDYVKIIKKKLKIHDVESLGVELIGKQPAGNLANTISRADFFVHTSFIENSPNSVAEAMIVGCPVIAANVGGMLSYISHGQTGWLYQEGDFRAIVGLMLRALRDEEKTHIVAKQGRDFAQERHNPQKIVSDIITNYSKVLDRNI